MNVVFTGNFLNRGWDGSITDETHIAEAFEELGHVCFRIDRSDHSVLPDFDFIEKPIDFVLISQYDQYPIDWVSRLRKQYRCPIILWSFDYQEWDQEWHERLVREADLYLSKRIADSKYPNWQWLSQDFSPSFLDKAPEVEKDIDVLFTGSYLSWADERNETLKAVDEKFNLHIYSVNPAEWMSREFKHVNGPVMDDALPALIARAKINLSIDHTLEAGYWSDRPAQIMCCGGFVLHRYQPLAEATFHNNIAYFSNKEQCLTGITHYLDCQEDRELIANEGYIYAQNNMTVHDRIVDLLTIAGSVL